MLGVVTLTNALSGALKVYYANLVVGQKSLIAYQSVIQLVLSFLLFPFIPKLLKKMGKLKALVFGQILMLANPIVLAVLRENATIPVILVISGMGVAGFLFANVATLAMIPDCTDYTEYKFGSAQAGFINAAITFARKCFRSLSTLIVGVFMGIAGYSVTPNSQEVVDMILNIKIIVPILLAIICLLTLKLYPITTEYGKKMRQELKVSRHG